MQRKICIKQYIVQKNDIPEDVLKIACVVVGFVFFKAFRWRIFLNRWQRKLLSALIMSSAQVVETSVTTTNNIPSQDFPHSDDLWITPSNITSGFKAFNEVWKKIHCQHVLLLEPYCTRINEIEVL